MQALVLVGGEGTRLRPLTLTQPKPAVPLVDRPLIRYMIDWLARHGVDEVIMACGFRADLLRERLGDGGGDGPRIRYMEEPEPLGTAGPLRYAADLLEDRFLALNGDVLTDLDLTALIQLHDERDAVATLGLHPVSDPSHYGLVRRAGDGEVLGFLEKPAPDEIDTDEISAGAYVLERSVLDLIPAGGAVSIEREVFPRLVGQGLYGRRLEGYWMDIGTPERYLQASWDIIEGRVESEAGRRINGAGLLVESGVAVDSDATVNAPAVIEDGATIGSHATVGARAVIGRGTQVGPRATVADSVVLRGSSVGPGAEIQGSIVAAGVEIGQDARLRAGCVIGEGAVIEPGVALAEEARIGPGEKVA